MGVKIQVLGPGCAKCSDQAQHAAQAVEELGIDADIEKITDLNEIAAFGVMLTPALVIDGEVKASGQVVPVETIKEWLA